MNEQALKVNKQAAGILVLIILMAVTFFFYLKGYSCHDLWRAIQNADIFWLLAGLGMMFLFIGCEAVNLSMITKALGFKMPFGRCLEYSGIGFYFSSITPSASGGQPAQIYYMAKDKISVTAASVTIFFTVFVYQLAMILWGAIMTFLQGSVAVWFILKLKYLFLFGVIVNTAVIFLLSSLMFSKKMIPFLASFCVKILNKFHLFRQAGTLKEKLEGSVKDYREKAGILRGHPLLFIKVLLVTMIQMAALNMIPSLVYIGLMHRTDHILDLITCQSLLTISVSAVPLPGAEGITQSGFLQVFTRFFKQDTLISAMLIHRALSFYIPLVFSFLVYIFTQLRIIRQVDRGDNFDGK